MWGENVKVYDSRVPPLANKYHRFYSVPRTKYLKGSPARLVLRHGWMYVNNILEVDRIVWPVLARTRLTKALSRIFHECSRCYGQSISYTAGEQQKDVSHIDLQSISST